MRILTPFFLYLGINVRHLGFLRAKVGNHPLSRLVLIEMVRMIEKVDVVN